MIHSAIATQLIIFSVPAAPGCPHIAMLKVKQPEPLSSFHGRTPCTEYRLSRLKDFDVVTLMYVTAENIHLGKLGARFEERVSICQAVQPAVKRSISQQRGIVRYDKNNTIV